MSPALRRFKTELAQFKRRTQFVHVRQTGAYARHLGDILSQLKEGAIEPRTGVGLVAEFFRTDEAVFMACDDSNGSVGDVFRMYARDLFVHFASACPEKEWLAKTVLELQSHDDYGVRDCLIDSAAQFLPEPTIRRMIDRLWQLADTAPDIYRKRHWLYMIESLARQVRDAAMYERAARAVHPDLGIANCLDIAEVYFESGDAETALSWLERIPTGETFEAYRHDRLLLAVHRKLGDKSAAVETAWRIFRNYRSEENLEQLIRTMGMCDRQKLLADETSLILRSPGLLYTDAKFLLSLGKMDEAEKYLLVRTGEFDGNHYPTLLELANAMENDGRFLITSLLYRALLESILARGISKYYVHGVRYLHKLDDLAPHVLDWGSFVPHRDYFETLRKTHARKSAFWTRYERKRTQ
jgi:tetratricopeptide (TPR) repeat protein